MAFNLRDRSYLTLADFNTREMEYLLDLAEQLKKDKYAGVEKPRLKGKNIAWPFLMNPLPNAYFTRAPQASIGERMSVNKMTFPARQRESMITEYILKYSPRFAGKVKVWRDRNACLQILTTIR